MPSFEKCKQAFENAIKTTGLEQFKKTSVFMSNAAQKTTATESQAA